MKTLMKLTDNFPIIKGILVSIAMYIKWGAK